MDRAILHVCVCVCVCVYLASYRMQLFATCLPEHKITSLRSICVIAHGSHVDTFLGLQMVQLFSNLLVHTWRSLFLKTMKTWTHLGADLPRHRQVPSQPHADEEVLMQMKGSTTVGGVFGRWLDVDDFMRMGSHDGISALIRSCRQLASLLLSS